MLKRRDIWLCNILNYYSDRGSDFFFIEEDEPAKVVQTIMVVLHTGMATR